MFNVNNNFDEKNLLELQFHIIVLAERKRQFVLAKYSKAGLGSS